MGFENLGVVRDLLYLAFLFFGTGLGCFLNCFRRCAGKRFRNRSVTIAFLFLSGAVAVFTAAFILGGGKLFPRGPVYVLGVALAILFLFAVRFPRAAGLPVFIAVVLYCVWTGFSFLGFPRLDRGDAELGYFETGSDGRITIRVLPDKETRILSALEDTEYTVTVTSLGHPWFFPATGGQPRGLITELRGAGEVLYADSRFDVSLLGSWYSLLASIRTEGEPLRAGLEKRSFSLGDALFSEGGAGFFYDGKNFALR